MQCSMPNGINPIWCLRGSVLPSSCEHSTAWYWDHEWIISDWTLLECALAPSHLSTSYHVMQDPRNLLIYAFRAGRLNTSYDPPRSESIIGRTLLWYRQGGSGILNNRVHRTSLRRTIVNWDNLTARPLWYQRISGQAVLIYREDEYHHLRSRSRHQATKDKEAMAISWNNTCLGMVNLCSCISRHQLFVFSKVHWNEISLAKLTCFDLFISIIFIIPFIAYW